MTFRIVPVRFRQRIILGFSALILLFLGVMIAADIWGIPGTANRGKFAAYRAATLHDMELVSGLLIQRISRWFIDCRNDIAALAASPLFRLAIAGRDSQGIRDLDREVHSFQKSHQMIEGIVVLAASDSAVLACAGRFEGVKSPGELSLPPDLLSRFSLPGYQETIAIHHPADAIPRLRIVRQILSPEVPDKLIALLIAESNVEGVLEPLIWSVSGLLSRGWECVLASNFGGVVTQFRGNTAAMASPTTLVQGIKDFRPVALAISGVEGPYDGLDQNGRPILAFHRHFKVDSGTALALVLKVDRSIVLRPAWHDLLQQCVLWIAMFIAGIGLCIFLARRIAEPIKELAAVARAVEAGDLSARATSTDQSETGQLAAVFNGMIARLQTWHQEMEQRVLDRTRDLQTLSTRQEAILSAAPDIIVELDPNGVYVWSNRAGIEFFGNDVVGRSAASFAAPGPFKEGFLQPGVPGPDNTFYEENWQTRKDGEPRLLAWWRKPLLDAHGTVTGTLSTGRDFTERKRIEKEKEKLEGQLRQALKMESVGRLAGGVAHDFNNMLGVISGHTELAMSELEAEHPLQSHLKGIAKAAERSTNLVRQLLAFARKQTVEPRVLILNEALEGMLKMLRRLIGENIDVAWIPKPDLWPVHIDPSQIDQILTNLCVNARDAISGSGKITIQTDNCCLDEASCAGQADQVPGEYVLLAVSDNGCGMDRATLDKLFEPFFTTKEVGRGTGLGLAMVYGIARQNNGFVRVYSEPGRGTTFRIYLPRYHGATSSKGIETPAGVAHGHETILLVEDEPSNLEVAALVLESLKYTVIAVGSPEEAIRLAQRHGSEIALLLTDVIMPAMTGRELAQLLSSICPGLKVLFMSGYPADVVARHGVIEKGIPFIQKPFSKTDLAAKIRETLSLPPNPS